MPLSEKQEQMCEQSRWDFSDLTALIAHNYGHLGRIIREFSVDGVILQVYRYCDPFGFDVPALKDYIEGLGTPVLYIEDDYSMSAIGRLRTRIQAFLEVID